MRRSAWLVSALALAACAAPPPVAEPRKSPPSTSREECLFLSVIGDWVAIDDQRLLLFTPGRRSAYLARLSRSTSGLQFGFRIGVVDGDGNGRICGHGSDALVFDGGAMPERITLRSLQRIDKQEADALLKSINRKAPVSSGAAAPAVQ